jgi:hypothetical protein
MWKKLASVQLGQSMKGMEVNRVYGHFCVKCSRMKFRKKIDVEA